MKKTLLTILLGLVAGYSSAQFSCPPQYQDSTWGAWPDTTTNFAKAYVGIPYVQELNFKAPATAGEVDPQYGTAAIQKYKVKSVSGLPTGFTYSCSAASCEYTGGTPGCANLVGTATQNQIGSYDITITLTVTIMVGIVPLPVDRDFVGYKLIIEEAPDDLGTTILAPNEAYVYPNPANSVVNIVNANLYESLEIYSVNGQLVGSQEIKNNEEKVAISNLQDGVYFIHLNKGSEKTVHKFVKN